MTGRYQHSQNRLLTPQIPASSCLVNFTYHSRNLQENNHEHVPKGNVSYRYVTYKNSSPNCNDKQTFVGKAEVLPSRREEPKYKDPT